MDLKKQNHTLKKCESNRDITITRRIYYVAKYSGCCFVHSVNENLLTTHGTHSYAIHLNFGMTHKWNVNYNAEIWFTFMM